MQKQRPRSVIIAMMVSPMIFFHSRFLGLLWYVQKEMDHRSVRTVGIQSITVHNISYDSIVLRRVQVPYVLAL